MNTHVISLQFSTKNYRIIRGKIFNKLTEFKNILNEQFIVLAATDDNSVNHLEKILDKSVELSHAAATLAVMEKSLASTTGSKLTINIPLSAALFIRTTLAEEIQQLSDVINDNTFKVCSMVQLDSIIKGSTVVSASNEIEGAARDIQLMTELLRTLERAMISQLKEQSANNTLIN